jgi:hypothetical protein
MAEIMLAYRMTSKMVNTAPMITAVIMLPPKYQQ